VKLDWLNTERHHMRLEILPSPENLNSMALVRDRTVPSERPRLSAKLVISFADRGVSRDQRSGSLRP
jgi:hypothetical protein